MSILVTIATYHSQTKAEAARIHLAQEGIDSVLVNETIVAMDWLLMNAIGGIKLQVASRDAERAASFINTLECEQRERLKSQAIEFIRFHCTECGEPQQFTGDRRGGVETCTRCGRYIDVPELSDEQMIEQHLTVEAATDTTEVVKRKISIPVEVGCVLAFAYIPLLMRALPFWGTYEDSEMNIPNEMFYLVVNALHVVPPLLFVMAVSNEPWSKFGITRPRWISDSLLAAGLFLVSTFVTALTLNMLLSDVSLADVNADQATVDVATSQAFDFTSWVGLATVLFFIVGLTANSIAEELAMRAYLIPRFEEIFKSPAIAVGLSSALFASYHIYQGTENAVAIFFSGIVLGTFFCLFRRIWPLVIAHTIYNIFVFLNM